MTTTFVAQPLFPPESFGTARSNAKQPRSQPFRFIDLFAGIGGIRMGLTAVGGTCAYTVELDRWAMKTYNANFAKVRPWCICTSIARFASRKARRTRGSVLRWEIPERIPASA
jgi:predicted RNA methylase